MDWHRSLRRLAWFFLWSLKWNQPEIRLYCKPQHCQTGLAEAQTRAKWSWGGCKQNKNTNLLVKGPDKINSPPRQRHHLRRLTPRTQGYPSVTTPIPTPWVHVYRASNITKPITIIPGCCMYLPAALHLRASILCNHHTHYVRWTNFNRESNSGKWNSSNTTETKGADFFFFNEITKWIHKLNEQSKWTNDASSMSKSWRKHWLCSFTYNLHITPQLINN